MVARGMSLALVLAAAACGGAREEAPAPATTPLPETPATTPRTAPAIIGVLRTSRGGLDELGRELELGANLALEDVEGGFVRLKVVDAFETPEGAAQATTVLANDPEVMAVIGALTSSMTLAAARVAQERGLPLIAPTATAAEVTAVGDFVFRACATDRALGAAMGSFTHETLGLDPVGILVDPQSPYSEVVAEGFTEAVRAHGGSVVAGRVYRSGDRDFTDALRALRAAGSRAIFVPGYYPDVATLAANARTAGITLPLLGSDGWDSPALLASSAAALEGAAYTTHFAPDVPLPRATRFVARHRAAAPQEEPSAVAALAYDAVRLAADAVRRAPTRDRRAVRDALAHISGFDSVTGPLTMSATRDPVRPIAVVRIRGGHAVTASVVTP